MLHILSAAILLGTGAGIAFFCWFGYRNALHSGDVSSLRSVLRLTVIADACFTGPAVVLQAVSGVVLMNLYGWPLLSAWSVLVWTLFLVVGACWLPVLGIQVRLRRGAGEAPSVGELQPDFHRLFRVWFALGVPAFTSVVTIYYLMVAKPLSVVGF